MRSIGIIAFEWIVLSLALAAADVAVPFHKGQREPAGILAADVPFHTGFFVLGKKEKCEVQTRFKIFHDGKFIYIGVEADEPDMAKLVETPRYPRDSNMLFRHDGIELNFDPSGKGLTFYKIMIDPGGDYADLKGTDDNTNSDRYIFDPAWDSHIQIATRKNKDKWTVEAILPFGAFDEIPADGTAWRFNVGRTRFAGEKKPDMSSFSPVGKPSHTLPRQFIRADFQSFRPSLYQWQMENLEGSMKKSADGIAYVVSANLLNRTGQFRFVDFRVRLLDENQTVLAENSQRIKAQADRLSPVTLSIPTGASGKHLLKTELYASGGELLKTVSREVKLEYQPVKITLTSPAYRDCVFATMPLRRVDALISLEEGIGKPLIVSLTGEGYGKEIRIDRALAENTVSFPFENVKDGRYVLTAGGVSKILRKLPRMNGEVWLDKEGVVYVDGKKFLPFGWFSDTLAEKAYRGLNSTHSYGIHHRSADSIRKMLDRNYRAGRRMVFYPYQELLVNSSTPQDFTDKLLQGSLNDKQKNILRKFVEAVKDHPGFLGYYLADEPEGRNHNPQWYVQLRDYLAEIDPYHPAILLNCGISGIRRYYEGCDILMPDCYPVFFTDGSTSAPRRAPYDFASAASALRPTWLVPQAFDWDWSTDNKIGRAPTFDELRNQILLGFAANIKGVLLYNYYSFGQLSTDLRVGTPYLAAETDELKDLLLAPTLKDGATVKTSPESSGFITGVKQFGNELCLIAVNTENRTLRAEFTLKQPAGEKLYVGGGNRSVTLNGTRFTDTFTPLAAHIYLTDSAKAVSYSLESVRKEIESARKARFKPGNLAAAGELPLLEIKRYKKGILPKGIPVMKVSSAAPVTFRDIEYGYFLQDGICEESPRVPYMSWAPAPDDSKPRVEVTFPAPAEIDKVVLYCVTRETRPALSAGTIEVFDGGVYREAAKFKDNSKAVVTLIFPKTKCQRVRLTVDGTDPLARCRLLSEMEVYGREAQ
ncbi:MAG: hypothetical protein BWY31_01539 [Lentisphaerae bacterium ADurb.Bin242]|nr:MAG: hypothetical protein BWY31_01539 [Lentisphaerae bacterium ADurb.Bin242]